MELGPFDFIEPGKFKEYINVDWIEGSKCAFCDYFILYEEKDIEISILFQSDQYESKIESIIITFIRIGEKRYAFQSDFESAANKTEFKKDIEEICRIFDNIQINGNPKCIKDISKINALYLIVDKAFNRFNKDEKLD